MSKNITEIGDNDFDTEVINSSLLTLVDFWAPWCGPCKAIAPVLEEIAGEYANQLKVIKINVSEHPKMAAKYQVRSIPNLIFFKSGEKVGQVIGAVEKAELVNKIKELEAV